MIGFMLRKVMTTNYLWNYLIESCLHLEVKQMILLIANKDGQLAIKSKPSRVKLAHGLQICICLQSTENTTRDLSFGGSVSKVVHIL